MVVLENLRAIAAVLNVLEPLVTKMVEDTSQHGVFFLQAIRVATADLANAQDRDKAGDKLFMTPCSFYEAALNRDVLNTYSQHDFLAFVNLLSPTWKGPAGVDATARMSLQILPDADHRAAFQERAVLKAYVEFMREDGQVALLIALDAEVAKLEFLKKGPNTLEDELGRLRILLKSLARGANTQAIKDAQQFFQQTKGAKLHKALCFFSNGSATYVTGDRGHKTTHGR